MYTEWRVRRDVLLDLHMENTTLPMYTWTCPTCKLERDVIRTFAEIDQSPDVQEAGPSDCTHVWQRILTSPPVLYRGAGWGKGKGHW